MLAPVGADLSGSQQCLPFWRMAHHTLAAIQISTKMVIASTVVPEPVCWGLSVSAWSTIGASTACSLKNVLCRASDRNFARRQLHAFPAFVH